MIASKFLGGLEFYVKNKNCMFVRCIELRQLGDRADGAVRWNGSRWKLRDTGASNSGAGHAGFAGDTAGEYRHASSEHRDSSGQYCYPAGGYAAVNPRFDYFAEHQPDHDHARHQPDDDHAWSKPDSADHEPQRHHSKRLVEFQSVRNLAWNGE